MDGEQKLQVVKIVVGSLASVGFGAYALSLGYDGTVIMSVFGIIGFLVGYGVKR